ncbi:MAG: imidazole glycerol phosphate synthase subunit HisH [Endozoicomonadaceae bacterium]|nr:imidazole glycerol phosphate synthase subunit HisH [Endozoicomonadaceae bacterium]
MTQTLQHRGTVIIDTRCANLSSVYFALQRIGDHPVISTDPEQLKQADRLILPGVGNAQAAMQQLERMNLISCITELTQPVLGICLGMQLMGRFSVEGHCSLLGIIKDNVVSLQRTADIRLPHMGWNCIDYHHEHPLLFHIDRGSYFYFVHSYAYPESNKYTVATCEHGQRFSAIVQKDNFIGVQFHPERSGAAGEQLLKNFLRL